MVRVLRVWLFVATTAARSRWACCQSNPLTIANARRLWTCSGTTFPVDVTAARGATKSRDWLPSDATSADFIDLTRQRVWSYWRVLVRPVRTPRARCLEPAGVSGVRRSSHAARGCVGRVVTVPSRGVGGAMSQLTAEASARSWELPTRSLSTPPMQPPLHAWAVWDSNPGPWD